MAKLIDIQYHLHYTPPSLDSAVNFSYSNKQKLMKDLQEILPTLLLDDCDLFIQDNDGHYYVIEMHLSIKEKSFDKTVKIYPEVD